MTHLPTDLSHRLAKHGQEHLLTGWDQLAPHLKEAFVEELAGIDFAELEALYQRKNESVAALPTRDRIAPLHVEPAEAAVKTRPLGEAALRAGEVAVLMVAGGQGTRLGFDKPKGMFPVGPVSGASLFQMHAEKVMALSRRYGRSVPFLVMTSPATHDETEAYFKEHQFFGLPPDRVWFFQQGTMPALDLNTGKLLLEAPGKLFLSPNGHGGTLTALADTGLLRQLTDEGVKHLFYFQVDNPLVYLAEPGFVGLHIHKGSEVSSKVVYKEVPEEKVGVLAQIDGHCGIIEYSDMPAEMTQERAADGTLAFRAGNPAIHIFSVPFLERVTSGEHRLAFHVARKKVPHYDAATSSTLTPTTENALKFELFVFDALPLADRWLALQTLREDEFAPLKNATGNDSPETCQRLQVDRARRWLTAAGVEVPLDATGVSQHPLEIGSLFALDAEELASKIPANFRINEPVVLR